MNVEQEAQFVVGGSTFTDAKTQCQDGARVTVRVFTSSGGEFDYDKIRR